MSLVVRDLVSVHELTLSRCAGNSELALSQRMKSHGLAFKLAHNILCFCLMHVIYTGLRLSDSICCITHYTMTGIRPIPAHQIVLIQGLEPIPAHHPVVQCGFLAKLSDKRRGYGSVRVVHAQRTSPMAKEDAGSARLNALCDLHARSAIAGPMKKKKRIKT